MTTEGRHLDVNTVKPLKKVSSGGDALMNLNKFPKSAAEVAEKLAQNIADTKADIEEIQKMADMVMSHSLQFTVNQELGQVIIKVVDPSTKKVIREIPSEDMQKLKARLKDAIGLIFDEVI
jgi:flagellar protein FlaG